MAVEYQWSDDGVKFGEKFFKLGKGSIKEVVEYSSLFFEIRGAWSVLRKAHLAFETGSAADYDGSFQKVRDLTRELTLGATESAKITQQVNAFFDPPVVTAEFKGSEADLPKFVSEVIDKLVQLRSKK